MDFLIGIEGADFVMLASDCSQARSIVVMKTSKDCVYFFLVKKYSEIILCWAEEERREKRYRRLHRMSVSQNPFAQSTILLLTARRVPALETRMKI